MVEQETITEDEAALYDRQIRLWGLDAQRRLRSAKVLLAGLRGLGAEVAKNIVLAGIKSLTLLDDTLVSEEDACSQFLVSRDDVGKNRATCSLSRTQQLNPMVTVTADTEILDNKGDDFFSQFDVVCVTCCSQAAMTRISDICHKKKIQFFAGDVYGYFGYMFSDLGEHEYVTEVLKPKPKRSDEGSGEPAAKKTRTEERETIMVKHSENFVELKDALSVDWTEESNSKKVKKTPSTFFLLQDAEGRRPSTGSVSTDIETLLKIRDDILDKHKINKEVLPNDFFSHCFAELSPVCAVVGGVLGQEIIKAVSKKDQPHNNFFFYNGVEGSGLVDTIGS
ncbi:SUMO-activating enzyme subunit 1-like isoform X2 [Liolophura sinensis]|uniref:SUMO-activating enzyme subunit 1-like isoform X2 n=1 Tax=Liolophura sinensis TaxID=3198878 RepID=UPI00315916A8